jgi:pimeloyl-ACP methyl ester carboxylesterase
MGQERMHRAVSDDGTEIVGRVHGQGPPLVLVHGNFADGEQEWGGMLPHLTDRFACHVPSTRGRDLSGAAARYSREAGVQDVAAYADSIGEPVGLVGVSWGGMLVLGAAARTPAATMVMAREPLGFEVMDDKVRTHVGSIMRRMREAAETGGTAEMLAAAKAFFEFVSNDEEAAVLSADPAGLEDLARYVSVDLAEFEDALEFGGYSPTDPSVLQQISAPVALLYGSRTALPWFMDGVWHAAKQVPEATVHEIAGAGHLGHLVDPQRDAAVVRPLLESLLLPT